MTKEYTLGEIGIILDNIKDDVDDIKGMLKEDYVTKEAFEARIKILERFVYGLIMIMGAGVAGLFWSLVSSGITP